MSRDQFHNAGTLILVSKIFLCLATFFCLSSCKKLGPRVMDAIASVKYQAWVLGQVK